MASRVREAGRILVGSDMVKAEGGVTKYGMDKALSSLAERVRERSRRTSELVHTQPSPLHWTKGRRKTRVYAMRRIGGTRVLTRRSFDFAQDDREFSSLSSIRARRCHRTRARAVRFDQGLMVFDLVEHFRTHRVGQRGEVQILGHLLAVIERPLEERDELFALRGILRLLVNEQPRHARNRDRTPCRER